MEKENEVFKTLPRFMLRIAMLPLESMNRIKANEQYFHSLREIFDEGNINEAILVASPSLHSMLDRKALKPKDERKAADSLFKYVSRMFSRATPFGLFASVGSGVFENEAKIPSFEELHIQKHSRMDMEWLLTFIDKLEQDSNIVSQLKVQSNHAISKVGKRLELMFPTYCGQGEKLKDTGGDTISVRSTPATEYILKQAKKPILLKELIWNTYNQYNGEIDISVVSKFVWEMFRQEFLISELRPPLLGGNPFEYVLEKLEHISGAEAEKDILKKIQNKIKEYDDIEIGKGINKFKEINEEMQSIITCKSSLQVDMSYYNKIAISKKVADSLSEAVKVMWRISTTNKSFPYMREYYLKFLEKYGTAVDVPLLEMVNENVGIGYPEYYLNGNSSLDISRETKEKLNRRRHILMEQIMKSIMSGFKEVILDDQLIEKLTIKDDWDTEIPDSMEVYAEILAPNKEAIEQGKAEIVINPNAGSFQAGLTFGRFVEILNEDTYKDIQNISLENQDYNENALMVDAAYLPTYGRTANIMMSKNFLPYELAIGTNIQEGKLSVDLDDLYVSADNERLFLKSKKYKKEVIIATSNMLNFSGSPKLFRLLKDLSFENKYYWQPFEWDTGVEQIYLPRLRYKNVILTPAQWNLNREMFEEQNFESEEDFFEAFQNVAQKWKIPKYVFLKMADNHILLNLNMKETVAILMKDLAKQKSIRLEELVGNINDRTLIKGEEGHYMTEIVFEVKAIDRKKHIGQNYDLMRYEEENSNVLFPFQDWLYINLYCPENFHNDFLINEVYPFANKALKENLITEWFFIRFEDPKPHIRLRLKIDKSDNSNKLLKYIMEWINSCRKHGEIFGMTIQPYERETARYGGPELIEIAEDVFCQDSHSVIALLRIIRSKEDEIKLFVGALSAIMIMQDMGLSQHAQLEMLDNYVGKDMYKQEFRSMRTKFLAVLSDGKVDSETKEALETLSVRSDSLKVYGKNLFEYQESLWNNIYDIISSLLHMNFNRLFGVDREKEKKCLSLARHAIHAAIEYQKHKEK